MRLPRSILVSRSSFRVAALLAVAVPALGARPAAAAVTFVVQRGSSAPSTIYIDGDHLRMEATSEQRPEPTVVIIDAGTKKMVILHQREKAYTEMTEEDLKRMREQMKAMRAQLAERMKNMPPAQRKQMEQMMGPAGAGDAPAKPPELKFEPLAGKKTVNGMPCEPVRVLFDGVPHEEDCILSWNAGIVKKSEFASLEKFGQSMTESLGLSGGNQTGFMLFHKYPGMPISRVPLEADGKRGEEEQVKSIKHGPVPPGIFSIPPGYTKKDLPQMGKGPGMGRGPASKGSAPAPRAP